MSYSDRPEDRKFVNFILKPQLERRRGYKLFLEDRDLLPRAGTTLVLPPGPYSVPRVPPLSLAPPLIYRSTPLPTEPSADLLVNLSRCRRLIVVLSDAFLRRPWCSQSFRCVRLLVWVEDQEASPASPDNPVSAGRDCAAYWSSPADLSSSPSRARGVSPFTLHSVSCASTATS